MEQAYIYVRPANGGVARIKATFEAIAEALKTDEDKLLISIYATDVLKIEAPSGAFTLIRLDDFKKLQ